jgi:hypothetical protein
LGDEGETQAIVEKQSSWSHKEQDLQRKQQMLESVTTHIIGKLEANNLIFDTTKLRGSKVCYLRPMSN